MSIRLASPQQPVNGVADMAFDFLSRLNQCRAEQAPATPSLAPVIDTDLVASERGNKAGLAAAASAVEAAIHDIDGRWPQRSEAYEIARRAVSAYLTQIGRAHGGVR